jgi:hypothetical protein
MKQSIKQKYSTFVQGIQKVARSDWSHSWIVLMDLTGIIIRHCTKSYRLFKCAGPIRRPGPFQHRRSGHLCGTACYSLPEKTRSNLYAVKRHNMSTATLQETAFHRSRGCQPEWHILHILHILPALLLR